MQSDLLDQGAALWPSRLDGGALEVLTGLFAGLPADQPGARIDPRPLRTLRTLPALQAIAATVAGAIGEHARPVRALLFDKHDGANWSLGWHQDRTIEVAERIDVDGFGAFTCKQGRLHVAPPIAIVERMVTVRIHIDRVDADNGVLHVAPGSHRMGYIAEHAIAAAVERCGEMACLAEPGQAWFYSTLILHRSGRAMAGRRRRVLQIDYAHDLLPGGLCWAADA